MPRSSGDKPLKDNNLSLERYRRSYVEQVAGQYDHVDVGRLFENPVKLRQPIVQIGRQKDPHRVSVRLPQSTFGTQGASSLARNAFMPA